MDNAVPLVTPAIFGSEQLLLMGVFGKDGSRVTWPPNPNDSADS